MLVNELGPLGVLARFRSFLANRQKRVGGAFDMISCVNCTSVYIGFIAALGLAGDVLELIMYSLSFSAVSVIINRLVTK